MVFVEVRLSKRRGIIKGANALRTHGTSKWKKTAGIGDAMGLKRDRRR